MVNVINVVLNSNPDRINHEAITAAAFGCMAALDTEKYLRNQELFEILASERYNLRMGSLEKGSTFKDGNKVVTVVGRFRDGTVLASTFSNDQMLPLKAAMSRVSNVLGREDRLNKEISNHGNYFGVIQDLTQSERPNVPVEQQRVLQGGLFNVATHLDVKDGLGETPEDVFVGGILTTKEGIKYRVQCPFARIATAWIKLENKVRRTESGN